MKNTISLQELIAVNNTPKAKALIIKYGYRPARSYNDLIQKLTLFTKEFKEDALKELVELHPHKDLVLHYSNESSPLEKTEVKSNCDGDTMCSKCKEKERYSNFEANNNASQLNQQADWKSMFPVIAVTSLVTASLVIILKGSK
jgi:hypothetical protein